MLVQPAPPAPAAARPVFRLSRCIVRPYRASDAASMRLHADDPLIARYLRDRFPHPYDEAAVAARLRMVGAEDLPPWHAGDAGLAPATLLDLAICLPDDTFIGSISLQPVGEDGTDAHTRELGYWVGRAYWGRGIASEAAEALTRWALLSPEASALVPPGIGTGRIERIEACAFRTNTGSQKVLEKVGFVSEGIRRRAAYKHGTFHDLATYSLLRSDMEKKDS